ncbi:MAG: C25 family cysteine peptidase [bacterium]|nr:C25 family cysteine peptidase [bacterium]
MRSSTAVTLSLLLIAASALAAPAAREVVLDPAAGAQPALSLLGDAGDVLTLELTLPRLSVEEVAAGGGAWQVLSFPDAAQRGVEGAPGLPVFSRLIALPAGATAKARIIASETVDLLGYRLLPVQGREGEPFVFDKDAYAAGGAAGAPSVEVGRPGVMHGLTVAPVVFSPLGYDPATGRVTAAVSLTVEVTITGGAGKAARRAETAAYDEFFRARVLNYGGADKSAVTEMGSYLVICPNNATVIANLAPLLDWRRRQGYNVVLATTAETGTTNTAIKTYLTDAYNTMKPQLEFVTLVGDANGTVMLPSWTEGLSGYNGGGDHYYSMLDGVDLLPDVNLGRLSVISTTELTTVVNKIVNYETNPPLTPDPGWFTRGSLVGDPSSSGITTIFVNQWVRDQLLGLHYTQIDSVYGGNYVSLMTTNYNKGGSLFTYRGWYGMSGMQPTNLQNLTNAGELAFAVIMTCDTGSFVIDTTCRSEAVFRAPNGGAVASVGTATTGTHTRYNNCMFAGVVDGVLNSGDFRVGPALNSGKLAMYNSYNDAEADHVEIWMVWNSLMGDPATEIWTSLPAAFSVVHAASISTGANSFQATVNDGVSGLPAAGARVSLYKGTEVRVSGLTNADGRVDLPLDGLSAGSLLVTVTKHDHLPYKGTVTVGPAVNLVGLGSFAVDDAAGNGDGLAGPGETVDLAAVLHNFGASAATGVTAVLTSDDPWVSVVSGAASYGTIAAGADGPGDVPFTVQLAPGAPAAHKCQLDLAVVSGASTWTSLLELTVNAGAFSYLSLVYGGPGGSLDPGETGSLTVTLRNTGNVGVTAAAATLLSNSPWVDVTDDQGAYGPLAVNATGSNAGDTFAVSVTADCFRGHLATFQIALLTAAGSRDTLEFTAPVGTAAADQPLGPDAHGYYAFDNTDTAYPYHPTYSWIEIDPALGGSGTAIPLTDYGWEQDDTEILSLPFAFTYYGETFDKISVCSNGWLAMGATSLRNYRNWTLPCAGSPDAMICAFWDNLYVESGIGGVYWWHDTANHRLVIEWSRLRNDSGGGNETFEVILYDPAHHDTDTGDGIIEVQYNAVSQVDGTNGYATAGLQNLDHTGGLLYTYWNAYPTAAASLTTGRAIRYEALAVLPSGMLQGTVTNASAGGTPAKDVQVTVLDNGRAFTSSALGAYLGSVPVGTYDIVASHPSFAPDTTRNVVILEGQTTTVDFSLVDVAGPVFANTTVLTGSTDTAGPYVVETEVHDFSGLEELHCWYLTSAGGGLQELPLSLVDPATGRYRGEIPGQPLGSRVRYWFSALDALGYGGTEPADAPAAATSFWIENTLITSSDMESAGSWTAGMAGDTATSGIWTLVDPNGIYINDSPVTPEDDHTAAGTMCWITGQDPVGGAQGGADVDGGATTLLSPVYNLTGWNDVTVTYFRWYTNETGLNPNSDTWTVQVTDDGTTWVNLESTMTSDRTWLEVSVPLTGLIDMTTNVRFRFIASDLGSGSVIEAGIDDFSLNGHQGTIDELAPTVTVTAPLPGSVHNDGQPFAVTWTPYDETGLYATVVLYSADGGATWPYMLGLGSLTSPLWPNWTTVPSSDQALVKVVCFDTTLNSGQDAMNGTFVLSFPTGADDGELPSRLVLDQNRPNPFNPATEIRFSVPRRTAVSLKVYDLAGRVVRTLVAGELEGGEHAAVWRGDDDAGARAPSGLYVYRLTADGATVSRKMMLLK